MKKVHNMIQDLTTILLSYELLNNLDVQILKVTDTTLGPLTPET